MKTTIIKEQILKQLKELNINLNVLNFRTLFHRNQQLANDIIEFTSFLPNAAKLRERIYCIENDIRQLPICPQCNKNALQFIKGKYRLFCSLKCLNSSEYHKKHCEETTLKHYGVKHYTQADSFQEEQKQKNLDKYGVESTFQRNDVINKCKDTKQKKIKENLNYWKDREEKSKQTKINNGYDPNWHNIEKALKTKKDKLAIDPHIYDASNLKRIKTCIERYGSACNIKKIKETKSKHLAENPNYYKEINEKSKQTKLERYGSETYNNMEKNKATKLERYGSETYNNIEKNKATMLQKYGVENYFHTEECKKKSALFNAKNSYEKFILNSEYDVPLFTLEEYFNRLDEHDFLKFKCKKCGNEFEAWHHDGHHQHCPKCYPKNISNGEYNVVQFISSLNFNVLTNNRTLIKPLELDIYIPDKKLAIEYDGLYWHSEHKDELSTYHFKKTQLCNQNSIQLIHIFENEWLYKQDIVKSRIKNLLGIYDNIVFARKCKVKDVNSIESHNFQKENHIQGSINAKVSLGLYYNNALISLMTFGKCRFDKKHEWEMLRFCNKLGYHIPGAAGKLLKYFERTYQPKSLVSYADRRWSQGKLYKALGFTLDHISKPDYWYWKNPMFLESRIKYQKHKLKNILEKFDESKSEVQNMKDNGYHRIFDCGNFVFEKVYTK